MNKFKNLRIFSRFRPAPSPGPAGVAAGASDAARTGWAQRLLSQSLLQRFLSPLLPHWLPRSRHLSAAKRLKWSAVAFVSLLLLTVVLAGLHFQAARNGAAYLATTGNMLMLSQRLGRSAGESAFTGSNKAFSELNESRAEFFGALQRLQNGWSPGGFDISPTSDRVRPALDAVHAIWQVTESDLAVLLKQQTRLVGLIGAVKTINNNNPALLDLSEQLVALKLQSSAPKSQVTLAGQLVMLTQRVAKNANAMLTADKVEPEVSFLLGRDTAAFGNLLKELRSATPAPRGGIASDNIAEVLNLALEQAFEEFSAAVSAILGDLQALADAKDASRRLVAQHSERLLQATQGLRQAYEQELEESAELPIFLVLGLLQLLLLWQMGRLYLGEERARRAHAERQADIEQTRNQANQNAILRLMDEMQNFAQGDLRARATVSEDITGAIADTVNYTVEELSILVSRVNQAATQLGQASATAQHTSAELLKAAELQRVEIRSASASVLSMARAINGVSGNAAQSAGVARQSLEAASKGGRAVQDAISGMGQIRDQIQDTAKRIKRLGESSQEIGGIVDLIAGITEQTNVLALNAAIQAASAGEAGRGFSVVAEEVQRLAERSAQATRQIATLVKSIQSDTSGAIAAMEKSTAGVVEGAQLSDAAGQALAEISQVSTRLAELIEDIANTTRSQAAEAGAIATGMEGILAITQQTMQGTEQTARSVGALAQLADGLKSSVSRFQTG